MEKKFRSACPIASLLDIMGDKWSLLIVRDMLIHHKKTFKELSESSEKIAPGILSARLKHLELFGLLSKYKLPDNKKENIYLLSKKGIELTPIIIEYTLWGEKYMKEFTKINTLEKLEQNKSIAIISIINDYSSFIKNILKK